MREQKQRSNRKLGWKRKVLFALFTVVVIMGIPESLLRWRGFFPRDIKPRHIVFHTDEAYRWVLAPNLKSERWLTFKKDLSIFVPLTTNSQGLRENHEIPFKKPLGEFRIIALGDSVTMGYGLPKEHCYEDLLERKLMDWVENRSTISPDSQAKVEVLNFGVNGYTTDQQRRMLKEKGMQYSPDLVLHQVCENDVSEFQTHQMVAKSADLALKSGFHQIWQDENIMETMTRSIISRSSLFTFMDKIVRDYKLKMLAGNAQQLQREIEETNYDVSFERYSSELLKEFEFARKQTEFVLLVFPQWNELSSKKRSRFAQKTIEFAVKNRIPYYELLVDMIELAEKNGIDPSYLNVARDDRPKDTHLNSTGSEFAAALLLKYLLSNHYLDPLDRHILPAPG